MLIKNSKAFVDIHEILALIQQDVDKDIFALIVLYIIYLYIEVLNLILVLVLVLLVLLLLVLSIIITTDIS